MSKRCSICGKYLSNMNLDFSRKIICSSCLLNPKRITHKGNKEDEKERYETDVYFVKKLYEAVKSGEMVTVAAIDCLERSIGEIFKNKRDMHKKMQDFLEKHDYWGVDLRRARKWSGMDRRELAWWFDVSIHRIKQMETNKKPLTRKAIDFIRIMGFKKTVTMKKSKKEANEGFSTRTPKKTKTSPKKKVEKQQVLDPLSANNEDEQVFYESDEKRDGKAQRV
ncbi:MAG: hypothetical protein GF368_00615 [Candidatus Aenigmarchaeota archaeon]|nr:hypothetical protein [Candidatus Aenigmarchaeota archaeon]